MNESFADGLILIADDNDDGAEMLAELVRMEFDCEVVTFADGQAALTYATQRKPHACLLDIAMPIMGGIDCAGALRALWGANPSLMIAVTGGHFETATRCGHFHHVMTKPADTKELFHLMRSFGAISRRAD